MKKGDIKTYMTRLNSKYRSGLYIAVREKGYRTRYYKFDKKLNMRELAEIAMRINRGERINLKKVKKEKKTKNMSIKANMKKGVFAAKVMDVTARGPKDIDKITKRMLSNATKNKEFLNRMNSETNLQKIRHNIETRLLIIGNEGEILGEALQIGKKTPKEAATDAQALFSAGDRINPTYKDLSMEAEKRGYMFKYSGKEGFINRIEMRMILRV